jgi:hypothetical protein
VAKGEADVGASWQTLHVRLATGACTLFSSSAGWFEPCGSWQDVQDALATG